MPSPLMIVGAVAGILLLLLAGAGFLLKQSYAANGALEVRLKNANAIIGQREEDMKTSALEIARLQGRITQIDATVAPVRERIIHVPVTTSCGPAIAAAAAGVRDLLTPTGGSPAGRQPPVALQPAGTPAK